MDSPHKLKDQKNTLPIYELYIERHNKTSDRYWSRLKIYLPLNTGIVVLEGVLLKDFLNELPFDVPVWLWIMSSVLFFVGAYLAWVWRKVCEDARRWLLLILKYIAGLEPQLFEENGGLYTASRKEYQRTKEQKTGVKDVIDINIQLAKFFFWLWVIALGVSILFLILTLICN